MANGKPITRKDAQALMTKQQAIVNANRSLLSADCLRRNLADAGIYYLSQGSGGSATNCFIFDIEHFEKFKQNGATQILAILGASEGGFPTILMVGCTQETENEAITYRSLSALADEPAVQHPPVVVQPKVPLFEDDQLSFTTAVAQ